MSSSSTPKVPQSRSSRGLGVQTCWLGLVVLACAGFPAHADTSSLGTIRFCLEKANLVFALDEAVGNAVAET